MNPNKASLLPLSLVCSGCLALGVSAMSGNLIIGLYVLECAGLAFALSRVWSSLDKLEGWRRQFWNTIIVLAPWALLFGTLSGFAIASKFGNR